MVASGLALHRIGELLNQLLSTAFAPVYLFP